MLVGQQIGPFSIEKEIGGGAMGSVYRARYTKTGQRVAIKIIAPGLAGSDKAMERFEREAAILKQLQHPNIVRLYASGKFHGTPFYAMEYVQGESLDRVMARRGRITWEEVVDLGKQLCAALQHAHEQGIIHRDLKPSNLMVLPDGTIKLTDFGIAKDMDVTQLTSANCTVGTASYMSPEQCRGERDLTHKSDLYSMGVLFYELITGRKPFQAETPMEMFTLHVQGTFERPSRLVLDLPIWLDNLICQLLEKKPEQRPLDAGAVSEALERVREKVEAQQSAGVDAVHTRIAGRARAQVELDEHDKEAARTLLGKKKKKGRRKATDVPFYAKVWFKAAVLLAGLVGIGFLLVVLLKAPGPDELYARAKRSVENKDWEEVQKIAEDYRHYYPDRKGTQTDDIEAWADNARVVLLKDQLERWNNVKAPVDHGPEEIARTALRQEEENKFSEAMLGWLSLSKLKQSTGSERIYGLLAEERAKAIYKECLEDLDKKLKAAAALEEKEPKEAEKVYEKIIDGYKDSSDPGLAEVVKKARERSAKLGGNSEEKGDKPNNKGKAR
jgi:serine/threonine-protein kinase